MLKAKRNVPHVKVYYKLIREILTSKPSFLLSFYFLSALVSSETYSYYLVSARRLKQYEPTKQRPLFHLELLTIKVINSKKIFLL